jgi:hypothetical protein
MSFTDQESPLTARRIAVTLGGFAFFLFIGLAFQSGVGEGLRNLFHRSATVEQAEAELDRDPRTRSMAAAFKRHYPDEYNQFLRRIVAAANQRGQLAARREAFAFMQQFALSKVPHIVNAPETEVNRLGRAIVALSAALKDADVGLCARFQMNGLEAEDQIPESVVPAMMRVNIEQFRAARRGEDGNRVVRGPLSEADADAWFARLEAIDARIAEGVANDSLVGATPQQQCDAGLAIYQAAMDLPSAQSANVVAELLRGAAELEN